MKFRVFVTNIYLQSRMKYTRDEKKKNGTGAQRNQSKHQKAERRQRVRQEVQHTMSYKMTWGKTGKT